MNCPKCDVEMYYVTSMTLGKQTWATRDEFDECPKCFKRIKRKPKASNLRFQRYKAGSYFIEAHGTKYEINRWYPEDGARVLWCVSIANVGMDDYKTLAQAKKSILADIEKVSAGTRSAD